MYVNAGWTIAPEVSPLIMACIFSGESIQPYWRECSDQATRL